MLSVKIDRGKCQGNGQCTRLAPATFTLDAGGKVVLGDPAASGAEVLVRAARGCPYRVISVASEEKGQIFPPLRKPPV